jgi:hypothetical protein
MSAQLEIWTVYDHPKDWPDGYIARKWIGETATGDTICADTLHAIRVQLRSMDLVCLSRSHNDDPVIVEVWL